MSHVNQPDTTFVGTMKKRGRSGKPLRTTKTYHWFHRRAGSSELGESRKGLAVAVLSWIAITERVLSVLSQTVGPLNTAGRDARHPSAPRQLLCNCKLAGGAGELGIGAPRCGHPPSVAAAI
jgi:hypothetical protein